STFFALLDPEKQQRCFDRVAAHLAPEGRFVIEAFVPDLTRFERGQRVEVRHVDADSALLSVSLHHPATQRVDSMLIRLAGGGVRTWPVPIRYSYPSELDLMAGHSGLRLEHRWGGWGREPFTDDSVKHVSVYPAAGPTEVRVLRPDWRGDPRSAPSEGRNAGAGQGAACAPAVARARSVAPRSRCARRRARAERHAGTGLGSAAARTNGGVAVDVLPGRRRGHGRRPRHVAELGIGRATLR